MKNWKISRLQIQAFKAFSFVDFDFESCSLLTMEGPNGYGKTTVFDAIELLLTGQISRITELHKAVMPAAKKLYKDNLYWNVKDGEKDIQIRGEISNGEGDALYFIRIAKIAHLKIQANNKADRFDIFKLHQLEAFDSEMFNDELAPDHLDTYFGEGFATNYSMLNYLQQGQSTFIFSKRITDRKNALEDLLKTRETRDKIDLCLRVERKLSTSVSLEQQKLDELQLQIAALANVGVVSEELVAYRKISTREPAPAWDIDEPFNKLNRS